MEERRVAERRSPCPTCPTSDKEMDEIRSRLDKGGIKMDEIGAGIRKNRKFDIAILAVAIVSFIVNLILQGGK
jgi:hypothetical protein